MWSLYPFFNAILNAILNAFLYMYFYAFLTCGCKIVSPSALLPNTPVCTQVMSSDVIIIIIISAIRQRDQLYFCIVVSMDHNVPTWVRSGIGKHKSVSRLRSPVISHLACRITIMQKTPRCVTHTTHAACPQRFNLCGARNRASMLAGEAPPTSRITVQMRRTHWITESWLPDIVTPRSVELGSKSPATWI